MNNINPQLTRRVRRPEHKPLLWPALAYTAGMTVHGIDHAMRGVHAEHDHAAWSGNVQIFMGALTLVVSGLMVVLVLVDYGHVHIAAMIIGFGSAALFLTVHLSPQWGAITDSFLSASSGSHVTSFSWITAAIGIAAAVGLGVAGYRQR